jgi:predicted dehydrogenase
MAKKKLGIGVIGCGNISAAYFGLAPLFRGIEMRAGADLNIEVAKARAKQFNVRAETVDGLLASDDVDIIVNLTIPAAHHSVSKAILEAGKHVYSEKPFVLSLQDGLALQELARARGLRIGSAPDTFLGGAHQLARHVVDSGQLGRITSGTCHVMSHGMEHWHPNPDFFFKPGGGPVLDLGPYYISNLVQLIGPVKRVAALCSIPRATRIITSKPRKGQSITVETPTTIHALLEFASGAAVTFNASWDVWDHGHAPMELYGEEGSLRVPDPNFFGGRVRHSRRGREITREPKWDHPFSLPNQDSPRGPLANYRAVGLCDMAVAIMKERPHRCSLELALHGIDVMTGILQSGKSGEFVCMQTTCARPQALGVREAKALLSATETTRSQQQASRVAASASRSIAA